jgi:phosphocarrier protein
VEAHDATATVSRDGQSVGGDSIMGLLMLAAARGCRIDVTCEGPEEEALMAALAALVEDRFGEGA